MFLWPWEDREEERVIGLATGRVDEAPRTITSVLCHKSEGGLHDDYSGSPAAQGIISGPGLSMPTPA